MSARETLTVWLGGMCGTLSNALTFYGILLIVCLALGGVPAHAQTNAKRNYFDDPFGQVTFGIADCPIPEGPAMTEEEARSEAHWRAERGTSCFYSGRCRLPSAYRYDREIFPRAVRYLRLDGRFDNTSIWITVQRRWIIVQGCVTSVSQGTQIEAALRLIDDVESVVGQWMVGARGTSPYPAISRPRR